MTSADLFDSVARIARHEVAARPTAATALVTAVHGPGGAAEHAVDLRLRDEGTALHRVPVAVGALGTVVTPMVGDLVVVVFTDGDVHGAVVVGRLHHTDLAPPAHADGQLVLALPPGRDPTVACTVDPGEPTLRLRVGEVEVEITAQLVTITSGDLGVELDGGGAGVARLKVGQAELTLAGGGDVSLSTTGTLTLEGTNVEIKGQAKVGVTGGVVDIN